MKIFQVACPALWLAGLVFWLPARGAERVDYSRDIRPLLSDRCYQCHGPDENARQADLRLDTREGLFADLGGYSIVVPGDVDSSEIMARILSDDESTRMPPPDSHKSLTDDEKQLLASWISQGAAWQQHWAFEAPVETALPRLADPAWCRNEIDYFILDQLQRAGLQPAPEADPYVLVRRLYLDLIGLPPSPEEADAWVEKIWPDWQTNEQTEATGATAPGRASETAYQELVSWLLNSPHYGERWARRWLDLARYADTNGY